MAWGIQAFLTNQGEVDRKGLKHPYKHPYGIAPCFPERLKRAQSTQIGSHDTEGPRIRYAVPHSPFSARSTLSVVELLF